MQSEVAFEIGHIDYCLIELQPAGISNYQWIYENHFVGYSSISSYS